MTQDEIHSLYSAAGYEMMPEKGPKPLSLAEMEKRYILHVIDLCHGNLMQAAKLLKISPSTLYRKRSKWDL